MKKDFRGDALPSKTLSLTFDDGPGKTIGPGSGPRTMQLANYLFSQDIQATFFVVGKYAAQFPDILSKLNDQGHLIGNHTFDHPNLIEFLIAGGDPEEQILRTDSVIQHWVDGPTIYFRPPYGSWSDDIADTLNRSLLVSMNHVGPIDWDIDGGDWAYWKDGTSVDLAVESYLNKIQAQDHGIILNHDCTAEQDIVKDNNRTLLLIRKLIPKLKTLGYDFVRIDEINEIQTAANAPIEFALLASNGKYVSAQNGGGERILVDGPAVGPWEPIAVVDMGYGKVALRAPNGLFYSPQDGGGEGSEVLANGPAIGLWEPLDLIQLKNGKVAFRTVRGHYLSRETDAGGSLVSRPGMNDWEQFIYCPVT